MTLVKQETVEACAQAAHEVNRAYCIALGDTSQPPWDSAPDWQKSSAREGVMGALQGFTPEESHLSWMTHKLKEGWRLGPVKDPDKKEHPCLVEYSNLPEAQRAKDVLFLMTVRGVGLALGLEVR